MQYRTHLKHFPHTPDEDKTFEAYYRRYKDIYITDCSDAKESPATSTKARNCGTQQVLRLYLTKKKLANLFFLETVKLLSELFSSKTFLFHKRWKCLNLTKRDSEDYLGFASVINKNYDDFKLGELSANNFKMSDIRTRPCVSKRRGNQTQSFVEIRERTRSHSSKTG